MAADNHLPGILRLDPDIRHRVYLHVGLGQRQLHAGTAPAVYDLGGPSSFEAADPRPEDDCGPENWIRRAQGHGRTRGLERSRGAFWGRPLSTCLVPGRTPTCGHSIRQTPKIQSSMHGRRFG